MVTKMFPQKFIVAVDVRRFFLPSQVRQCQVVVDETEVDDKIEVEEYETRLVSSGTKADKIETKDED